MPNRSKDGSQWIPVLWACCCAFAVLACAWPARAQPTATTRGTERLRPLEVRINQAKAGVWTLLERDGSLYAPEDALTEWRLNHPPAGSTIQVRGETWFPLNAIPGFEALFNEIEQSVDLVFSAAAFATTRLTRVGPERIVLSPVEPAVFLNYDLSGDHSAPRGQPSQQSLGMLGDLNVAEPEALIGFAGPRVIEQTVRETLPEGFQRSEFLVEHGAVDLIIDRRQMRDRLGALLALMMRQPAPVLAED